MRGGVAWLSDAAFVGYLEGGDETRPVVVFSMNLSVPDPGFYSEAGNTLWHFLLVESCE